MQWFLASNGFWPQIIFGIKWFLPSNDFLASNSFCIKWFFCYQIVFFWHEVHFLAPNADLFPDRDNAMTGGSHQIRVPKRQLWWGKSLFLCHSWASNIWMNIKYQRNGNIEASETNFDCFFVTWEPGDTNNISYPPIPPEHPNLACSYTHNYCLPVPIPEPVSRIIAYLYLHLKL